MRDLESRLARLEADNAELRQQVRSVLAGNIPANDIRFGNGMGGRVRLFFQTAAGLPGPDDDNQGAAIVLDQRGATPGVFQLLYNGVDDQLGGLELGFPDVLVVGSRTGTAFTIEDANGSRVPAVPGSIILVTRTGVWRESENVGSTSTGADFYLAGDYSSFTTAEAVGAAAGSAYTDIWIKSMKVRVS